MNNELQKHKTSDTVKWVLTLLAFILVGRSEERRVGKECS